ncbi:MAG TPA: hypothetical protein VE077_02815 [Candidatus Methylomirabilis sp.]|nr:hypothetical protein [Candidatus Methylomirabilis sp.]
MQDRRKTRRRSEQGVALLIAIFVLLLISVVAIALLVSTGTETALGANYRSSSTVYYAALAGLEEARGRLLAKNPNYFGTANIPSPFPLGQTEYVLNRLSGENIAPWDSSNQYYDKEYQTEFGVQASSAAFGSISSVWDNNAQGIPGPVYKWVRINAATEQSLFLDVDADGHYDNTTPIYYDLAQLDSHGNPAPSLIVSVTPPATAVQVLQITAMAALPNGSQKLLQYVVAPAPLNLSFPAAVVLDGDTPQFTAPTSASFFVKGNDQGSVGTCNPVATPFTAVGYTDLSMSLSNNFERPGNAQGISTSSPDLRGNYSNSVAPNPDVAPVTLSANLQTVGGLNDLVQIITDNADVVFNGDICVGTSCSVSTSMPAAMSASNPMTIVVKGDLKFSGWRNTGYGLLLVTGDMSSLSTPALTYDPDAFWNGIILVIGKGWIYSYQGSYTTTQIQGAVLVAKTIDASGNPLPLSSHPASSYFNFTSSSATNGIYYSSCWIQAAQSPTKYQVLSFHEIPQP